MRVGEDKPVIYLLHGDDEYALAGFVHKLYEKLGEPGTADLNTARLDGRSATLEDLRSAALSMPFLAERRLVIVSNPLARLSAKAPDEKYRALLESLPETTAFVLLVVDTPLRVRGQWSWSALPESHWLMKWARGAGARVYLHEFPLPRGGEMPGWIRKQAQEMGGQLTPQAAAALAGHVSSDTRLASNEIAKLLTYVNFKRPVEVDDVELLTAEGGQADVFAMVDALGSRDGRTALRLLHTLLENEDAFMLFGMIVRQFRLLLLAREVMDEGGGKEAIAKEVGVHPFVAEKLVGQARYFPIEALEAIYRRLLDLDEAMKTSQMSAETAFDTFIAGLTA